MLELDYSHLCVKVKQRILTVLVQPILSIRNQLNNDAFICIGSLLIIGFSHKQRIVNQEMQKKAWLDAQIAEKKQNQREYEEVLLIIFPDPSIINQLFFKFQIGPQNVRRTPQRNVSTNHGARASRKSS